jgi:hypothetical protein
MSKHHEIQSTIKPIPTPTFKARVDVARKDDVVILDVFTDEGEHTRLNLTPAQALHIGALLMGKAMESKTCK